MQRIDTAIVVPTYPIQDEGPRAVNLDAIERHLSSVLDTPAQLAPPTDYRSSIRLCNQHRYDLSVDFDIKLSFAPLSASLD
jgi:hypothetical protein